MPRQLSKQNSKSGAVNPKMKLRVIFPIQFPVIVKWSPKSNWLHSWICSRQDVVYRPTLNIKMELIKNVTIHGITYVCQIDIQLTI